jgi:hypothetical protein
MTTENTKYYIVRTEDDEMSSLPLETMEEALETLAIYLRGNESRWNWGIYYFDEDKDTPILLTHWAMGSPQYEEAKWLNEMSCPECHPDDCECMECEEDDRIEDCDCESCKEV